MKTYLDMDEILRHCRRYIGQEYDEPYLVSAVPEEVIRSLPPADVRPVVLGKWIDVAPNGWLKGKKYCSHCKGLVRSDIYWMYCPQCGADMREK